VATDFRDGQSFPRRGRVPLQRFLWLARVYDKARASAAGTIGEYVYPCPIDRGMFERWGITPEDFDAAARRHRDDDSLLKWASSTIPDTAIDAANSWLVVERFENLDRQDREEGAFATERV
jgi:hypothetical protein